MKKNNTVIEATKDVLKGGIKLVASAYILKNTIENACIKAACNIVNRYIFKDDEDMFD